MAAMAIDEGDLRRRSPITITAVPSLTESSFSEYESQPSCPHEVSFRARLLRSDSNTTLDQTAWHRDTVAAPFPISAKSLTINIYLDDIGADAPNGDVLIYAKGSHNNLTSPPDVTDASNLYEPSLKVGDVLAHDPHVYHTPSGRGCWNRRSLQFRYVEAPMTFTFPPNRFPHGPIPWTMAHAADIAPHGLEEGSPLEGAWYPLAYSTSSDDEHVPIKGRPWGILNLLSVASQAQKIADGLGIGAGESCTIHSVVDANRPTPYFGFDGPVTSCKDWEMVGGVPVHKDGQMILSMQKM